EDTDRPTIENDVVDGQEQDVLLLLQANQAAADQRPVLEIELRGGLLTRQTFELLCWLDFAKEIVFGQSQAAGFRRQLLDEGALAFAKGRSQGFVAGDDPVERAAQRCSIERSGESKPDRNVVGPAEALELSQKPQALLRERELDGCLSRRRLDGRHL